MNMYKLNLASLNNRVAPHSCVVDIVPISSVDLIASRRLVSSANMKGNADWMC